MSAALLPLQMFSKNFRGVTKIPRICLSAPAAEPCSRVCGQAGADGSGGSGGSGGGGGAKCCS